MDGSDELATSVDALYRAVLRSSELSTQVDTGLVASLAVALTAGGARRELADCTDLASTGGPGSISTMLVPLMARASGVPVAKVGVPGRPAGAVDVLSNVPGYRWSSTAASSPPRHLPKPSAIGHGKPWPASPFMHPG